jgi:hypothetical protein
MLLTHGLRAAVPKESPIQYIGSVTKAVNNAGSWDTSDEALDVLSVATVGDLVVIAFSFDSNIDSTWSWVGMNFTSINNQTGDDGPGAYVGYRFVQPGDTNPYVLNVGTTSWRALSIVASVFRNVNSYVSAASAAGASGLPNAPSLIAAGKLWVATGHLDDDAVSTWVAPTNYTLASFTSRTTNEGDATSSTVVAYRIATLSSDDPGAFTASSGSDEWRATTLAFA